MDRRFADYSPHDPHYMRDRHSMCPLPGAEYTLFLLRRQKGRMGNRSAEFAAIVFGCCVVIVGAFIFSAHIFSPIPSIQSPNSAASGENGISTPSGNSPLSEIGNLIMNDSLFSSIYKPGNASASNTIDTSNRSARLAAFLALQETPV